MMQVDLSPINTSNAVHKSNFYLNFNQEIKFLNQASVIKILESISSLTFTFSVRYIAFVKTMNI